MKKIFFTLFLFISLASTLYAGELMNQLLRTGTGIRALSMGGAFASIGEESDGLLYNPAGLDLPGESYVYENLDNSGATVRSSYGSYVHLSPFAYGYVKREAQNGDMAEASVFGFGKRNKNGIDWGVSYKVLNESINSVKTNYWSSDVGMLFHLTKNFTLGIAAQDVIKSTVTGSSAIVIGGSAYSANRKLGFATDMVLERLVSGKDSVSFRFGAESQVSDGLTLRGGWFNKNYTAGAGLSLPFFELDYAILIPESNSTMTHQFGIRLGKGNDTSPQKRYALFKPKSFAEFSIGGNLVEGKSQISLLGGQKVGSNDLIAMIHEAAEDDTCKGFLIRVLSLPESLSSVALIQEIRNELLYAQKRGKIIICYLDNWATLPEYYLASCADKIMMPELGTISHLGIEIELLKTKTFLQNFGIEPTVIANGAYKDSLVSESDALDKSKKLVLEALIQNLYAQIIKDIKQSRKLDWTTVKPLFDGRLISAREAKSKGMIDQLGYWRNARELTSSNITVLPLPDKKDPNPTLFSNFNRIAVVEVDGVIYSGKTRRNMLYGSKGTGSEDIERILNAASKDFTVRGVILRVNSPGGSIVASEEIYQALEKVKKAGKLVYVSMGNVAASGGYFISMNADKIYANLGTLTGSIGVISQFQNKEGLHDMLGIERDIVKTGQYMDLFSENKGISQDEIKLVKAHQNESYAFFTKRVMDNRKLTAAEIKDIAQGQVFTGEQALKFKLIDKLGGFYKVVSDMGTDLNISGKPELIYFRTNQSLALSLDTPIDFFGGLLNQTILPQGDKND